MNFSVARTSIKNIDSSSTPNNKMILLFIFINLVLATMRHEINSTGGNSKARIVLFLSRKCQSQQKFATDNARICQLMNRRAFVKHFCAKCQIQSVFHHAKPVSTKYYSWQANGQIMLRLIICWVVTLIVINWSHFFFGLFFSVASLELVGLTGKSHLITNVVGK